jgi:hypothetical protein
VELPLFALHTVLFPGRSISLHVFEDRYLRMMGDVLPSSPFAVAAIRYGREVGGSYDPYRVGVRAVAEEHDEEEDGTYSVQVRALERVRLVDLVSHELYARWRVEPLPEQGSASPDVIAAALAAATRFLAVAGVEGEMHVEPESVELSYALAALTPLLVPDRQALLELPGPAERLAELRRVFTQEAGLLQALRRRREG